MSHRLTTEEFVTRAQAVHGDYYGYDQVDYVNNRTKVAIKCPVHGVFWQAPGKHMAGNGCPSCGHAQSAIDPTGRIAAKRAATCRERYGADNPMQVSDVQQRHRKTCQKRFGADSPLGSSEVREKIEETNQQRYGAVSPLGNADIRAKGRQTMMVTYGVVNPMQDDEIKQQQQMALARRYGVSNPMQLEEVREKVAERKREAGTFNSSEAEEVLFGALVTAFGDGDVVRQYRCDEYPCACDFYIPSRQLFIELNAFWTHGGHWFNPEVDQTTIDEWHGVGNTYYENAIYTWEGLDVWKRDLARKAQLNYVVFWDSALTDAMLWFGMGCPDGQDWEREYSWLPQRQLGCFVLPRFNGDSRTITACARGLQSDVFYARELEYWNRNGYAPKWGTVQARLYANRYRYIKKLPDELSDLEILRGLSISGAIKNYTVFSNRLMTQVLDDYEIKSVYDPCAGWGERLLTCAWYDIEYHGVDINEKLAPGYEAMIERYSTGKQSFQVGDSSLVAAADADAVITCPPYGDTEIYSEEGAENLDAIGFVNWWRQVVARCSKIPLFCFQVNQKYRRQMEEALVEFGYEFDREYDMPMQSSHFTRRGGKNSKREFECMLVYKKVN